jgi:transcriptional regulator with XRE-family HTH domain
MAKKGWNQSDLARAATKCMPGKKQISRDRVSNYIRQVHMPTPAALYALADALGTQPEDLVPEIFSGDAVEALDRATENTGTTADTLSLDVKDAGDGYAHVFINQRLPWGKALEVLRIVTADEG